MYMFYNCAVRAQWGVADISTEVHAVQFMHAVYNITFLFVLNSPAILLRGCFVTAIVPVKFAILPHFEFLYD